ncbi:MAG: sugar phosphate isomerase/epimerase [Ruminococcaceae bacterium]|nr:sugar phosphate isomerase/epimerase [Oscillospiraceae bacterium]
MKIGAQLFTVRDFATNLEDFSETLKKIADIGYTTVQVSGTCEFEAEWLRDELAKNGLSCVLTHTKPDKMLDDPLKVCRDHDIFGCRNIGLGMMQNTKSGMPSAYAEFLKKFTPVINAFKDNGHKFFYHNHHVEFERDENGILYLDRMCEDFSADLFGITFDTYWAQVGGVDPATYLSKLAGRVECIHLKDLAIISREQRMAVVGEGNINFDRVFEVAERVGVEYMLVEQDNCYGENPFDCLTRSYKYLKAQGFN